MAVVFELDPGLRERYPQIGPIKRYSYSEEDMVDPPCKLIEAAIPRNRALAQVTHGSVVCINGLMRTEMRKNGNTGIIKATSFDIEPQYPNCASCIVFQRRDRLLNQQVFT